MIFLTALSLFWIMISGNNAWGSGGLWVLAPEQAGVPGPLRWWEVMGVGVGGTQAECVSQPQRSCSPTASRGGQWGAWMPSSISAFEGTCVSIPCRFSFPDELRPAVVHGVWYFNSPYPKNYPPVVFKSRTQVVHESFQGRSRLLGDLGLRNCTLLLSNLSPELGGKYYFRGDLGGYNQYTFSEHSVLDIISESRGAVPGAGTMGNRKPSQCPSGKVWSAEPRTCWFGWREGCQASGPHEQADDRKGQSRAPSCVVLPRGKQWLLLLRDTWEKGSGARGLR